MELEFEHDNSGDSYVRSLIFGDLTQLTMELLGITCGVSNGDIIVVGIIFVFVTVFVLVAVFVFVLAPEPAHVLFIGLLLVISRFKFELFIDDMLFEYDLTLD